MLQTLKSETGWTGELWSKTNLFNWPNKENSIFSAKKKTLKNFEFLRKKVIYWISFAIFQDFLLMIRLDLRALVNSHISNIGKQKKKKIAKKNSQKISDF